MLLGTIVSFASILLELSFASPFYSMQPAHIVANIGTTGRNIRHLPCVSRKSNQKGVCMFAIDCLKSNGTHLGTCIDRFYFGSCCRIDHVNEIASNTIDAALIPPDRHHQHVHIQPTTTTTTKATTYSKNVSSSTAKTKIETPTTTKPTLITKVPTSTQKTKSPLITTTTAKTKYATTVKPQRTTTPKLSTKYTTTTSTKSSTTTTTDRGTTILFYGDKIVTTIRPKPLNNTQFNKIKITTKPSIIQTTTNFPEKLTTFQNVVQNTVSYETTSESLTTTPKPSKPTTSKPFPTKKPSAYPSFTKPKPTTPASKPLAPKPTKTSPKPYVSTTTKSPSAATQKPTKAPPRPVISTKKPIASTLRPVLTTTTTTRPTTTTKLSSTPTKKTVVTSTLSTIKTTISTTTTIPTTTASKSPPSTNLITNSTEATLNASATTKLPVNYPDYTTVISLTTTEKIPTASTDSNEVSVQLNGTASEPLVTGNVDTNEIQQEKPLKPLTSSTSVPEQPERTTTQPFVTWTIADENASSTNKTEEGWKPITAPDWVLLPSVSTTSPSEINVTSTAATSSEIPEVSTIQENATTPTILTNFTETLPLSSSTSTLKPTTPELTEDTKPVNMSDFTDVCGRRMYPEARIVGGERSSFGKWPWQVSLRQWRTSTYLHKCGAALLNENWAITAAHCVDNVPPSDLLLRFGEHDLSTESEPHIHQERRVQIVASHPEFDPRTFEYDLALLRFYEPLDFQPNIIPVCVPQTDQDFVGRTAYVTGWGRLYEDGPLPSVLQEVSVPVINNSVCESMYRSAGYIEHIPHIFICAGWRKGGFDSCEGDSGGPMVIQRQEDKRFVLAGIISWGIGCAEPNQPGVYTRISEFKDWINQILQF